MKRALVSSLIAMSLNGMIALPTDAAKFELEPYELVRSFQRIQEEIALGDRHALGMQKELYKKVRQDLIAFERDLAWDERNLRAVLTFAIGGGGRSVLRPFERSFLDSETLKDLAIKVNSLTKSNASEVLAEIDVQQVGGTLGASIALIRGLNSEPELASRVDDLDYVRMSLPGTLHEESALRGLLVSHRQRGSEDKFLRIASRYARIFGSSPYSIQFSNELVEGSLAFDDDAFHAGLVEVIDFLEPVPRVALRDRIARSATVNARQDLFFAIEKVSVEMEPQTTSEPMPLMGGADQKVLKIYNTLGVLSVPEAEKALSALQMIVPTDLKPENRTVRKITIQALQSILQQSQPQLGDMVNVETEKTMPAKPTPPAMSNAMKAEADMSERAEKLDMFVQELRGKIDGVDALLETIE